MRRHPAAELIDPGARYLQYRLTLESTDPEASPLFRHLEVEARFARAIPDSVSQEAALPDS